MSETSENVPLGVNGRNSKSKVAKMIDLTSKVVCITGTLPVTRREAAEMIVKTGGIFTPRVTRQTDILVVGIFPSDRTSTRKYAAALKLIDEGYHIVLISPSAFLESIHFNDL